MGLVFPFTRSSLSVMITTYYPDQLLYCNYIKYHFCGLMSQSKRNFLSLIFPTENVKKVSIRREYDSCILLNKYDCGCMCPFLLSNYPVTYLLAPSPTDWATAVCFEPQYSTHRASLVCRFCRGAADEEDLLKIETSLPSSDKEHPSSSRWLSCYMSLIPVGRLGVLHISHCFMTMCSCSASSLKFTLMHYQILWQLLHYALCMITI